MVAHRAGCPDVEHVCQTLLQGLGQVGHLIECRGAPTVEPILDLTDAIIWLILACIASRRDDYPRLENGPWNVESGGLWWILCRLIGNRT